MLGKTYFIFEQYLMLLVFVVAFYGHGKWVGLSIKAPMLRDGLLQATLRIAMGLGASVVLLQIAGFTGFLNQSLVQGILVMGLIFAFIPIESNGWLADSPAVRPEINPWNKWSAFIIALAFLAVVAPTLALPLYPPIHWDDLMYHLPHVREWVQAERITINEWLRYPYFPYNFNLLYVAWMAVGSELNTNMLHALAGWLIAVLAFQMLRKDFGVIFGLLGAAVWISVSQWFFQTSYIDLGAALFVFVGSVFMTLWIRQDNKADQSPWLLAAAFFMGLAAGTKYQAFTYLPFFMLTVVLYERRIAVWLKISVAFLLPCLLWYLRNWLVTGNPVNPLAGGVFGYFDWNQGDYDYQLFDLKNARNWPPKELWPALLLLVFPAAWKNRAVRWWMLLSIYAAMVWAATSHYDRYLVPQYPILAMMAVLPLYYVFSMVRSMVWKHGIHPAWMNAKATELALVAALFAVMIFKAWPVTVRAFVELPITAQDRHVYLYHHARGFGLLLKLKLDFPEKKVYQVGLEGGIFYGPSPVYGDHFGPWRYRDFIYLSVPELHQKLMQQNFDILAVDRKKAAEMEEQPDFWKYFEKLAQDHGDTAYQLLKD